MEYKENDSVRLSADGMSAEIIDQTLLPNEKKILTLCEPDEMFEAIRSLRVRGAPAIGIFAGYCLYVLAARYGDKDDLPEKLREWSGYLGSARPTAVNLTWALERVYRAAISQVRGERIAAMRREAENIHIEVCRRIAQYGLTLVRDGDGILTHCNAGALATSRYGTGLGALLLGKELGYEFHAYVDETRPLLQGARLTSYELYEAGVDCTLICDNMASQVMKEGRIQACFAGCDRAALNGDCANKIGTSAVAVLAKYYGIPFYIFCPISTIDAACASGENIVIEERSGDEIKKMFFEKPIAPEGVKCYDPAFDVTDHTLITAIVTEKGIIRPPFGNKLAELVGG